MNGNENDQKNPAGSRLWHPYGDPVAELLQLGELSRGDWINYVRLGIGPEHLPSLIRMAVDPDIHMARAEVDGRPNPIVWAAVHAIRAMGELQDERAVAPLLNILSCFQYDDWMHEAVQAALTFIGPPAIEPLAAYCARPGLAWIARSAALDTLTDLAARHPAAQTAAVDAAVHVLTHVEAYSDCDAWAAVEALQELGAAEHTALMRRVFMDGRLPAAEFHTWKSLLAGIAPEGPQPPPVTFVEGHPWPSASPVARLRVTLRDIEPPIWREIEVKADHSLLRLHHIIQAAMGWWSYHLYSFTSGSETYIDPRLDESWDSAPPDMRDFRIIDLVPHAPGTFTYLYDYGDDWYHDVELLALEPAPVDWSALPRCTGGARACPPEDCGGVHGYGELLEALADPSHEDHDEMRTWAGDDFDPESFDLAATNRRMRGDDGEAGVQSTN